MTRKTLLIINGPGMAELTIDTDRYGSVTLAQIDSACKARCDELDLNIEFRQSDDKEELIGWLTKDSASFDAIVINPFGGNSTQALNANEFNSAIESLAVSRKPLIEVHLTNIFKQPNPSTTPLQGPPGSIGFICGLGLHSYLVAIDAVAQQLSLPQ